MSLPSSNCAAVERGSSGHGAMRWLTSVPETVTSQPSKRSSALAAGGCVPRGDVRPRSREEERLVLQRLLRVDHHRQRVVVDHDQLGRIGAGRAVVADDDREDLADEAHDVLRHHRPAHVLREAEGQRAERRQVDVVCGQDAYAGERFGRARVDPIDLRVGEQRADERDRGGALEGECSRRTYRGRGGSDRPRCAAPDCRGCSRRQPITAAARESRRTFG